MSIEIEENILLAEHTTLKVGGPADYFVRVSTEEELIEAVSWSKKNGQAIKVLGGGSNVLVADTGFAGLVIKNEIKGIEIKETGDEVVLRVGAGEGLDELVEKTVAQGWWGIENLSHIPSTVGAMPIQNVGAYGVEAKDVVESVEVYDAAESSLRELSAADCQLGYRDSIFKHKEGKDLIVTHVTLKLSIQPKPNLAYRDLAKRFAAGTTDQAAIRAAVIEIRSQKFPNWKEVGTAGSFFKNPVVKKEVSLRLQEQYPDLPTYSTESGEVKLALGYILDKICGLKGYSAGKVGIYEGQALVLVNLGEATASEIIDFAELVRTKVKEKTGVEIEWEVTKW